ncbi:tail fiber domain-containing protein [Sinorhizobium meliloti]|uniref:tail fiber domain-containing protein n=1 Tax=Rhizobium meliloti TaxID=382 RepID=UPI000FD6D390|nr:tail fiber domain-containing protein [Sinorhizobium meliloti]RVO65707.1 tail fiber domain-containing protein [Sinorhizobium meliloti]
MAFSPNAETVYADGPFGSPLQPSKPEIRSLLAQYEAAIDAYSSGAGSIAKSTRALLFADLAHAADVTAWVYADSTVAYNGIYRKSGASGSGSWSLILPLPFSFIIASDVGAGTPNAIQATTSIPVSASALIWMNVAETNTASPVTVSFNGEAPITIKTNSGSDVAAGGLTAGMIVMGIVSGSTFRLVSDQASSAIIAQAEAAAAAALAAANAGFVFATEAEFLSANIPPVLNFVRTAGYYNAGDAGAHTKERSTAVDVFAKQAADGSWWAPAKGQKIYAEMFGAKADYDPLTGSGTENSTKINKALAFSSIVFLAGGFYMVSDTVEANPYHCLFSDACGYSNPNGEGAYWDMTNQATLIPRNIVRRHVIDAMITQCELSGGVLDNPSAAEAYTGPSGGRLAKYRIMDFTNQDAVGATAATPRLLSIALLGRRGSIVEGVSVRTTRLDGSFSLQPGDTNFGEQCDIGYFGENAFFGQLKRTSLTAHFRDAAFLLCPTEVLGDDPDFHPQSDRFFLDQFFIEGHASFAVRGADTVRVSAVSSTTIRVKWFKSHRFSPAGSVTINGAAYAYTSLTYDAVNTELVFGGLSADPAAAGVVAGAELHRTQDVRTFGTGGVSANNGFLRSITHPSLKPTTESFFTDNFPMCGRVIELSGLGVRGIHFNNVYVHGREDVSFFANEASDISFGGGSYHEAKWLSPSAGVAGQCSRFIGLKLSEKVARGVPQPIGEAGSIIFTTWSQTEGGTDMRPVWRTSPNYSRFGTGSALTDGLFYPAGGWNDAYPQSQNADGPIEIIRAPALRGTLHPIQYRSATNTIRGGMDSGGRFGFGFNIDPAVDLTYGLNLMAGSNSVINAQNNSGGQRAGYRAQNTTGIAGFYMDGDGIGTITLGASDYLRFGSSVFRPASDNLISNGTASFRWKEVFAGTGTINTSDERAKLEIEAITDIILDAWADVEYTQFKMVDAVAEKGVAARLHFGLVAQRVRDAFAAHGLDPYAFGVLCYDQWDDVTAAVMEDYEAQLVSEGSDGEEIVELISQSRATGEKIVVRAAGDQFGLRYAEAFALEAAYQRRRMARIESQLAG